jgi:hypothetical protein
MGTEPKAEPTPKPASVFWGFDLQAAKTELSLLVEGWLVEPSFHMGSGPWPVSVRGGEGTSSVQASPMSCARSPVTFCAEAASHRSERRSIPSTVPATTA